jgi:hypothetical protein
MKPREMIAILERVDPDSELGFFDGEGHWCKIVAIRRTRVDEADWRPRVGESQTGAMRDVLEFSDSSL